MADSNGDAILRVCNKIMHGALRLALEVKDPNKVVNAAALMQMKDCKCTGYLMLFFTENTKNGAIGVCSQAAGMFPLKANLMLLQYYPSILANLLDIKDIDFGGIP